MHDKNLFYVVYIKDSGRLYIPSTKKILELLDKIKVFQSKSNENEKKGKEEPEILEERNEDDLENTVIF